VDQILHIDQINSAASSLNESETKKSAIRRNSENVFDFSEIILNEQEKLPTPPLEGIEGTGGSGTSQMTSNLLVLNQNKICDSQDKEGQARNTNIEINLSVDSQPKEN
jgi:hypothetical protein